MASFFVPLAAALAPALAPVAAALPAVAPTLANPANICTAIILHRYSI